MSRPNQRHPFLLIACIIAPAAALADPVLYRLMPHSMLRQDVCVGACACPPHHFDAGVRGSFFLTPHHSDPLFDYYRVSAINWRSDPATGPIHIAGGGIYRIGGEVALMHQMELNLRINDEFDVHADSGLVPVDHQMPFPFIGIRVITEEYGCYQLTLDLDALPDRCPADLNHSGSVSLDDLTILLSHYGTPSGAVHEDGDMDGDADVDLDDLAELLSQFGQPCPA